MSEFHLGLSLGLGIGAVCLGFGIYVVIDAGRTVDKYIRALDAAKRQRLADKETMGAQNDLIHELMADLKRFSQ